jgi:multicomponent Na+:H+ antiporter subunit F
MILSAAIVLVACMLATALFLAFARLVRGPSIPDRVLALDLLSTLVVGVVAVYTIASRETVFLDAAIVLSLIAFLGTVAFARYIEKGGAR